MISNVNVVEVLWGSFVDAPSTTGLDQFFTDVTTSSYFGLLAEYSTVGLNGNGVGSPPGSNQIIGPGTFGGKFTINPSLCPGGAANPACTINDTQIQSELVSQLNAGHLPQPTQDLQGNFNTVYMIYFPPGVTIVLAPGVDSCRIGGFCAYHSNVLTGSKLPYGVFPDFSIGGCSVTAGGCGPEPTAHDNLTLASSHELAEAVTDVDVGSANDFAPPLAWADQASGQEIGDFCNHHPATIAVNGVSYAVQAIWSNLQNACVAGPAIFQVTAPTNAVPTKAFNVTVSPQSGLTNAVLPNYNNTVQFTSSDGGAVLPAKYTFVPASDQGSHTFSVTLNSLGSQSVTVTDTLIAAMAGTFTVNVQHNPDVTVVSSHSGNFRQGDVGDTYTLTATNVGDQPTIGSVTVTDSLPGAFTATAIGGTGWNCQPLPALSCTRSDVLLAGASYPPITLMVNVSNTASTPQVNTAQVSGGGEVNTFNDTSTDSTIVIQVADLVVSKTHSGSFSQGQVGETYTLLVQNAGTGPTVGVVTVTDTLPIHLTATAISGAGWTCVFATLSCTRSDVLAPNGQYPPVSVTVNIDTVGTPPITVTNTATVAGGGEVNTSNDSASDPTTITTASPDLDIISTHSGSFTQGQTGVIYTLTVSNVGTMVTEGVVTVADNVSLGLTITAMSGAGWTCNLSGNPSCFRSDSLATGSSYPPITVTADVSVTAPASVINSVVVSGGGEQDSGAGFNDPTTIIQLADMTLSASSLPQVPGGIKGLKWTITAKNVGAAATTAPVTVVATLTTGATATAITGSGWNCTLSTLTCTRGDTLAASATYPAIAVTLSYDTSAGSVVQTATVSGGGEVNTANDTVSLTVTVLAPVTMFIPNPAATVPAGSPANYVLFIVSFLPGSVHFSCNNLPQGAACGFSSQDLPSPALFTSVNLTITTNGSGVAGTRLPGSNPQFPLYATLLPVIGLAGIVTSVCKRKSARRAIRLGTVTAIMLIAGCGGHSTPRAVVTPAGTYTITVVANNAAANTQASKNVTLIVR